MSVLNKFMDAIRVSDYEDDELLDEIEDEEDDDFLEEEVKPKKSFMERFSSRKKAKQDDDYLDEDDIEDEDGEDAYDAPEPAPVRKSTDSFSASSSYSIPKPTVSVPSASRASKPSSKITPMRQSRRQAGGANDMYVQVLRPANYDDGAKSIADYLLKNYTIVLNLEGLDLDLAQRLIDFTSGCTYALNGTLQKASNYIFIIGPSNVEIGGDIQNILGGNMAVARAGY